MLSCFGSTAPESALSGVDVAVLNGIDVGPKDITMTMCMIVHAVLDVDKLKTGLFAAIEHKVPRAEARLASRNGLHEFHIPQSFSDATPPCAFTYIHHHIPFVGTAGSLPPSLPAEATSEPYLVDASMSRAALCRGPNTPREVKDFLVPGTPLVHVHIASFDDATLIGTTTSHAMFDAQGFRVLFDAWTAALRGDLDSFPFSPRVYATYDHIAKDVTTQTQSKIQPPPDQPKRGFFALGFFDTARFLAKFLLRVVRDPRERTKLLYVPHEWLAKRKEECTVQLSPCQRIWI
ncbi:hypothetical protein EXIGLDRAFT_783942 [Exidia glandulosa HHB12029]|uniref:Transferase n=1 Tax=Exidia glandulosa HHB12029 TaxID=1314781 RepID=A0A166MSV5_EXIGL|nr:hypothetical protein EXIGLDRAFT_783942 [Exidia glandulosa HHB12029]